MLDVETRESYKHRSFSPKAETNTNIIGGASVMDEVLHEGLEMYITYVSSQQHP